MRFATTAWRRPDNATTLGATWSSARAAEIRRSPATATDLYVPFRATSAKRPRGPYSPTVPPLNRAGRVVAAVVAAFLLYLAFGALSGVWDPEQDNTDTTYVLLAMIPGLPGLLLGWLAVRGSRRSGDKE